MKTQLLMGVLFTAAFALAQSYSIDWHTIDGGGGTSIGGGYALSGTIGQPDATPSPMAAGSVAVNGGFWALPIAVQTAGGPLLSILASAPGFATISWTPDTPGCVLQQNTNILTTNWVDSASGTTNPIVVPITTPTMFYRLR